jgi:hypothetical protein
MLSEQYEKLLKYDPLSEKETMALIRKVQNGNVEAAWYLVCKNTKLVFRVLLHGFPKYVNDESFSDGLLGLYKAITRIRRGTYFGHFVRFSVGYIRGYILNGIQCRSSQLSPSRITSGYKNCNEISKDEVIEGNDSDFPAFFGFFDPTVLESADYFAKEDGRVLARKIFQHAYRTQNQAIFLSLMLKHNGNVAEIAKEMKKSRQYIHGVKNGIRKNLIIYLRCHPNMAEEFFEKKLKILLDK